MIFTQITTGPWQDDDRKVNHAVYALGTDGQVYRFQKYDGWVLLKKGERRSKPSQPTVTDDDIPF